MYSIHIYEYIYIYYDIYDHIYILIYIIYSILIFIFYSIYIYLILETPTFCTSLERSLTSVSHLNYPMFT